MMGYFALGAVNSLHVPELGVCGPPRFWVRLLPL